MEAFEQELKDKLNEKGIPQEVLSSFVSYGLLLAKEGSNINLTSLLDANEIAVLHFFDSLLGEDLIPKYAKVIDIGSGAGFPAIPIAIIRSDLNLTLVEATAKKVNFLNYVVKMLNLKNVQVINARAENLAKDCLYASSFDVALSRATAALNVLLELSVPFLKIGGFLIAYKAAKAQEELLNAANAMKTLGIEHTKTKYAMLDGQYVRNLLLLTKHKEASSIYPRSYNKIKSKPL